MPSFDELKPITVFSDGLNVVCYKPSGSEVIVGGPDAAGIKIHDTDEMTQEYVSAQIMQHTEDVTCIAATKDGFASGGTDGLVILYTNDNAFQKILVRSTTPIRDIAYHPNGTKLAITSDDHDIRIVLVRDNSKIVTLKGHKASVKSVSYSTDGNHLVSSDSQGTVLVWSLGEAEPVPRCVKILPGACYSTPIDSLLQATTAWSPDNTCFATPGRNHDIRVYSNGIWQPSYTLEGEHTSEIITFAWSPNGYYLATSDMDKHLVIWDTKTKKTVRSDFTSSHITSLAWHPEINQLIVADSFGQITFWDDVIPEDNSNYPHPALLIKKPMVVKSEPRKPLTQRNMFEDLDASQMDDNEEEDEEEEDLDMGDDVNMSDEDGEEDDDGEGVGDFVIDDDGAGYVETPEEIAQRQRQVQQSRLQSGNSSAISHQIQRKLDQVLDAPITFQPGETPFHKPESNTSFAPTQGERRYMAYNLIAAVTTIFESDHSVINVEFHDQSEYRNYHFSDSLNFSMAAISSVGAIFAVEGKDAPKKTKRLNADGEETSDEEDSDDEDDPSKQDVPSTLYFRPNNWGTDKDWTLHMLPGEDVVSVAINRVSVVATTSLGYVRIFSTSGIQRHVFSLSNVVSIAAMTDLALIVYSTGPSYKNQQNLKCLLINTESNEVYQDKDIHLSANSVISWVGFSETNQAAICDSSNVMFVLANQRRPDQGTWVPVFDGKAHALKEKRTEKYWPVGLLRDRLMCVVLRGANEYPFFPRPPIKDIPLSLPMLNQMTEQGQLEEEIVRIQTRNTHERDEAEATNAEAEYEDIFREANTQMDIGLLKLINLACKAEKASKALDLTNLLHTSASVDKAIRIAIHYKYTSLAEKMTEISSIKFSEAEEVTPSTIADSLARMPPIYTTSQSGLESDLSFSDREKRSQDSYMLDDLDTQPPVKKSRPFRFSS